jgi:AcrR family transcriptional regulator
MVRMPKAQREDALLVTRQRLLDAATVEFATKGFAEANINHISQAAGFAKGTIYNYFPSKVSLLLELITESGARHVQYIAVRIHEFDDPAQRLVCFFEAGFRFVEEYPAQARFLITTLYSPGVQVQDAMFQAYQPMFRMVAEEIVAPGIQQGLFRPIDPLTAANLLMTLYLGTGSHVDANGKVFMDPRLVADFALRALERKGPEGSQQTGTMPTAINDRSPR